jgi:hypothetical protein
MSDAVAISVISGVVALITTALAGFFSIKVKKLEKINERKKEENIKLKAELNCVSVLFDYNMLTFLNQRVEGIFETTKAERFIVLFAINGKLDFNFVSVCFEKTKTKIGAGAIFKYVRLQVDRHYKEMLKEVERDSSIYLEVSSMPDSLLKDIYQSISEGVKYSSVHFLTRGNIDESNDIVIFSSLATTNANDFTKSEKVAIKGFYDEMRSHANLIDFKIKTL